MPTHQALNELSIYAKFVVAQLMNDTYFTTTYGSNGTPGTSGWIVPVYEEVIPIGADGKRVPITTPAIIFVMDDSKDDKGAFGYRLKTTGLYQIKAVVEGADFSLIADLANVIDRLFDWQNQIDISAGRPKSQQLFTDPDVDPQTGQHPQIMVMAMLREVPVKYSAFVDGVNYCHQGGRYMTEYYQP